MHTVADVCQLSSRDQELLGATAANQGELAVRVRADTRGPAVCTGRKRFYDPADRSVAQQYIASVSRLKELQLIRETDSRNCFQLTNFGWQLARKLAKTSSRRRL